MANLDLIKKKEEVFIIGQERRATFIRVSLKQARGTVEGPFGGVMEAGMKESLGTVYKVDGEYCIERVEIGNTKETGITECSMVREPNISRTVKDMKELLNKINSMDRAYSTKMTQ